MEGSCWIILWSRDGLLQGSLWIVHPWEGLGLPGELLLVQMFAAGSSKG